jgi:hypothetical protein
MEESNIEDMGHWQFDGVIPSDTYGFIYEITNKENGKKYIGKKQMLTTRKLKPLKGKKRKRKKIVETDWRKYSSSCNQLNEELIVVGSDAFEYRILRLCCCKWELSYYEAKLQFECDVLLSDDYYNGIINLRVGNIPARLR